MNYKIGFTWVYHEHNNLIHLYNKSSHRVMISRVSGQCSYIYNTYWQAKSFINDDLLQLRYIGYFKDHFFSIPKAVL